MNSPQVPNRLTLALARRMTERFSLPPPRRLAGPLEGSVNVSYVIELSDGARWICRIDALDRDPLKILREEKVYRWLWERAPRLPVARAYHADVSHEILPFGYALLPALPGDRVGAAIEGMARPDRDRLLVSVGELLRRLHGIRVEGFGDLVSPSANDGNWRAFLLRSFDGLLRRHRDALGYPASWSEALVRLFPEWLGAIPETISPAFLHGDFHYDNLLFDDGDEGFRISGLFDLEWAWAGDPACDLLHLEEAVALYPDDAPPLLDGYGISRLPSERLRVYRVLHTLRLLAFALSHRPDPRWDLLAQHDGTLRNLVAGKRPFLQE